MISGTQSDLKLEFYIRGNSEKNYGFLYVEASSSGTAWRSLPFYLTDSSGTDHRFTGGLSGDYSGQWHLATVDLGSFDNAGTVHVRFRFASDADAGAAGWFIDNIALTAASNIYSGSEYRYMSGTSMAAPHVSGLAALVWGHRPDLTYAQVKSVILSSVDKLSALTGKVASGGRINALNALNSLDAAVAAAPTGLTAAASSSGITLNWEDNSSNESGFLVERRLYGASAYTRIATVSAGLTRYADTAVASSTTYIYRVAIMLRDIPPIRTKPPRYLSSHERRQLRRKRRRRRRGRMLHRHGRFRLSDAQPCAVAAFFSG